MNAAAQELITVPTRRDRWGRYLVLDEDGLQVGLTRATTISGSLDDKTNLIAAREGWSLHDEHCW